MIRGTPRLRSRAQGPRPRTECSRPIASLAWVAACLVLAAPHAASAAKPLKGDDLAREVTRLALDIRSLEESGNYARAAEQLRSLRRLAPADADLELAWALNLARAGERDSAATLLYGRLLTSALADTTDRHRFQIYGWRHEDTYFGGRFEGWYWYVARARLEVDAQRGRWGQALDAARVCTRARPLAGVEWYLLALCAARTGHLDDARSAADRALRLAPILPEAHYLAGVLAWRDGRRVAAQREFRAAVELDSTYREAAVALMRARLPVPPDPLPGRLLNGLREAALITSRIQPKFDEFYQLERPAVVTKRVDVVLPDSLAARIKPIVVRPLVLFDFDGRAVYHEDRWAASTSAPDALVGLVSAAVRGWQVTPGTRHGRPQALWLELDLNVSSAQAQGE